MDLNELLEQGERLFERGDVPGAVQLFRRLVDADPGNARAWNNLGVAAFAQNDLHEAEQCFRSALGAEQLNLSALSNLAQLFEEQERWSEAAQCLEKILVLSPGDCEAREAHARVSLRLGRGGGGAACPSVNQLVTLAASPSMHRPTLPAAERAALPLNVLFFQESPCIRNYKMAKALRRRGHRVTLAYTQNRLSEAYPGLSDDTYDASIRITSLRSLWDTAQSFDLIHCHNEPDHWSVAALACGIPVVHDTHDLISLRANGDQTLAFFEGIANRGAAGRVYSTPYQMAEAKTLYGVEGPCLVLYNYTSEGDLPRRFLPKLSQQDGAAHIVYEGGVNLGENHRNFSRLFVELAAAGVRVHIYPHKFDPQVQAFFAGYPNVDYRQPVSPQVLMEEMTQYDYGIIPFNLQMGNKRFLDSTIANKLFEYLAAGLPVIASPLQTYVDYFRNNPVGITFNSAQEICAQLPLLRRMAAEIDFSKLIFTYESEIHKLEEFYNALLAARLSAQATHPEDATPKVFESVPQMQLIARTEERSRSRSQIEAEEKAKYEQIYQLGYNHYHDLKPEIVALLERNIGAFETAVDLGCGTGKYAHFLQERYQKTVLGIDLVNHIQFPNIRFCEGFAWNLDTRVDLVYAIDLLEHIPTDLVPATIEAIAKHCSVFVGDVSTRVDKLGDKIGKRLHLTVKESNWWIDQFSAFFADVKVLRIEEDGFIFECRKEPEPIYAARRAVPDFAEQAQISSTIYRDFWNAHAASLPWRGTVLYIGSNDACRRYYTADFFGCSEVIHVDIDPANRPDVVASAEDLRMFADGSVDGIAFFGTPYVVNDPCRMIAEFSRISKHGALLSGSFNGAGSRWRGTLYSRGQVKGSSEVWHFDESIRDSFADMGVVIFWAAHSTEYYHLTAARK